MAAAESATAIQRNQVSIPIKFVCYYVVYKIFITYFLVDLLDFIDWSAVECLNQSSGHSLSNALKQGYREDEGFNLEIVKLHSIDVKGSEEEGPKTVKLFRNREHMGFSNVNDFPPSDTAGKSVALKCVKFQNVRSLTIFIEDNQSGSEITKVQKTALYGSTVETTDMKGLKKIEEH
ncbi:hypothetical protein ES332_D11G306200v1 [Gossypium tomentosum]|uniref:PITH domain-containing protein n=1 Tax=Gossypium tomentosum TaxID=34277 RepID=A0A5D2IVB1_GOSTO|nr:hypothetical protein ES332_D11G306200v1 [Gossypium tomentosum]